MCTGPRASRGAGPFVSIAHAGLDLVEEPRDLLRAPREDASREPVLGVVGVGDRFVEARDFADCEYGDEQLIAEERARQR